MFARTGLYPETGRTINSAPVHQLVRLVLLVIFSVDASDNRTHPGVQFFLHSLKPLPVLGIFVSNYRRRLTVMPSPASVDKIRTVVGAGTALVNSATPPPSPIPP